MPIDDSGRLSAKIVKDAELKVYPGAPHGLFQTHKEQFNADLSGVRQALIVLPGSDAGDHST